MEKILNFSIQHTLTEDQLKAGLVNPELSGEEIRLLNRLLLVDPHADSLWEQCSQLVSFIAEVCRREGTDRFHLMGQGNLLVGVYLLKGELRMFESTTERISNERMVDGAVQKTITFKFVKLREYGV